MIDPWVALKALLDVESVRIPMPGALILWAMPSNDHDDAKASIQAVAWANPTRTLWIVEAEDIAQAVIAAASKEIDSGTGSRMGRSDVPDVQGMLDGIQKTLTNALAATGGRPFRDVPMVNLTELAGRVHELSQLVSSFRIV